MSTFHSRPAGRQFQRLLHILVLPALLFCACQTDSHSARAASDAAVARPPEKTEGQSAASAQVGGNWKEAASLADLEGLWESSSGSLYEYPFRADGKKYLRIAWKESDDTELWKDWARQQGYDMQTLWQIRFASLSGIYGQKIPVADANGSQYGLKISRRNGRIYTRREMLISERLLLVNLQFFRLSPDRQSFIENGSIRLASDVFSDLSKGGTIYRKKHGGN